MIQSSEYLGVQAGGTGLQASGIGGTGLQAGGVGLQAGGVGVAGVRESGLERTAESRSRRFELSTSWRSRPTIYYVLLVLSTH